MLGSPLPGHPGQGGTRPLPPQRATGLLLLGSAQNCRAAEGAQRQTQPLPIPHQPITSLLKSHSEQGRPPSSTPSPASPRTPWLFSATFTHRFIFALSGPILNSVPPLGIPRVTDWPLAGHRAAFRGHAQLRGGTDRHQMCIDVGQLSASFHELPPEGGSKEYMTC